MKIKYLFTTLIIFFNFSLFSLPFNSNLSENELYELQQGKIIIRNINNEKKISLKSGVNKNSDILIQSINKLNPKYLAEVIEIIPINGNEDLVERLTNLLENVPDYSGIPLWSERHQTYFDLYSSAEIISISKKENSTEILADLLMDPFGHVQQNIVITNDYDSILYFSENLNTLKYYDDFKCVSPKKMNMDILLFKDEDNWILYGIGGVNAPKIPFFSERIQVSFINRIKTFCNFIFTKLNEQE